MPGSGGHRFGRARHALRRTWHALSHSLRLRLVALFLLLALALAGTFLFGMQKALGSGWRAAARPLVADYVDRLVAEIGTPPSIERAQALAQRLPVAVRISGPRINWDSRSLEEGAAGPWVRGPWGDRQRAWEEGDEEPRLLSRNTTDGHRVELSLNVPVWHSRPRRVGWITLAALLALTGAAYAYVRLLLRPLDDIRSGASRFGAGKFGQPIPVRRPDELGDLAAGINTMAHDIHQMLEAKRALLLAISHELRSPLTRARVNTELLPETAELRPMREALLRDLGEMRDLVSGLLESERLGQGHAALQLEPTDFAALVREVVRLEPSAGGVRLALEAGLPMLMLDQARVRLLVRNLLDNALRHGDASMSPASIGLRQDDGIVTLKFRDHGPGVAPDQLPLLAEPFFRTDAARQRATGGVGLGLYLCRLVAQAHGATFGIRDARPGLEVTVKFEFRPPSNE